MDDVIIQFYKRACSISNALPKALANYLCREVIEVFHSKYNIPDVDMKQINKKSVNRAALFIKLCDDPKLKNAFLIEAVNCSQWDEPEMTKDIERDLKMFKEIADNLDWINI